MKIRILDNRKVNKSLAKEWKKIVNKQKLYDAMPNLDLEKIT